MVVCRVDFGWEDSVLICLGDLVRRITPSMILSGVELFSDVRGIYMVRIESMVSLRSHTWRNLLKLLFTYKSKKPKKQ